MFGRDRIGEVILQPELNQVDKREVKEVTSAEAITFILLLVSETEKNSLYRQMYSDSKVLADSISPHIKQNSIPTSNAWLKMYSDGPEWWP